MYPRVLSIYSYNIIFMTITSKVLSKVDTILFSLLILRGLSDSKGCVWRCHPSQLYAIEVTVTVSEMKDSKVSNSLNCILCMSTE